MSMIDIYVRDKQSGRMHRVGDDIHDMLTINDDGQLCYHNLQNGDGCHTGDNICGYEFVPNQDEYGYNCVPTSRKELSKIPSAQPETHDKRTKTHACDLISRQEAIDALNESIKHFDDMAEECRRNANIERNDYMDMRDDAAEYRQLSIWLNELKWLRERFQSQPDLSEYSDKLWKAAYERGKAEAQRKKGKWIPQNLNKSDGMISTAVYYYPKCSVCGANANYTNFCPNCGAEMEGQDE